MNTIAPVKPHSGLGIASTIVAVLCGLGLAAVFAYAGVLGVQNGGQALQETDPRVMMIGLGVMAGMAGTLIGALLGIAGLFVGDRRRVFAWVGLILNALPLLVAIVLIALGLSMA